MKQFLSCCAHGRWHFDFHADWLFGVYYTWYDGPIYQLSLGWLSISVSAV